MQDYRAILKTIEGRWKTAQQIADECGMSEKSIRTKIHSLNPEGAEIVSVRGKGYSLTVTDKSVYEQWLKDRHFEETNIPQTRIERIRYILKTLLFAEDYIKRITFADLLYVSEKTVSTEIKQAEEILSRYHLAIERVPGYGMRITGSEFSIRQCMLNHAIDPLDEKNENVRSALTKLIGKTIEDHNLTVPEYLLQSLTDYLALSIRRMQDGHYIEDAQTESWPKDVGVYYLAESLVKGFRQEKLIDTFTDSEVFYVSLYIWGNRILNEYSDKVRNYVIPRHTHKLVKAMISLLIDRYCLKISHNNDFYRCMLNHTLSLEIRMKYNIRIANPDTDRIKDEYTYAFHIAERMIKLAEDSFESKASEDEISFYAILLQAYIPTETLLLRTAAVVNTERAEDHAVIHRFADTFRNMIRIRYVCAPEGLNYIDHEACDLIIQTQKADLPASVPHIRLTYHDVLSDFDEIRIQIRKLYKEKQTALINNP